MRDLNPTDIELLRLMQQDASLSNKQLALKVNKSMATTHERLRRLKEQGFIKKVVAILNPKKVNCGLLTFAHVHMNDHASSTLKAFVENVVKFPEVLECFQMSGSVDFILRVASSDMDAYSNFYNRLCTLPNIRTVESYFVLTEAKSDTAYPI
jgi:Lrp/AsnC family leucine-responsive transcriptional regulator